MELNPISAAVATLSDAGRHQATQTGITTGSPPGRNEDGPAAWQDADRAESAENHRELLTEAIRGPWRPSGTAGGVGVFAVVWSTRSGDFWAALHDFSDADRQRLIEACRWVDRQANGASFGPSWGA